MHICNMHVFNGYAHISMVKNPLIGITLSGFLSIFQKCIFKVFNKSLNVKTIKSI